MFSPTSMIKYKKTNKKGTTMCKETISTFELLNKFPDHTTARKFIEQKRWGNGVQCPVCQSSKITSRRGHRESQFFCRQCSKDFSVRTGTVFACSQIPLLFKMSVALHGKTAQESTVLIDTTVQEKNITYPTDAKLAIKIINRLNKLAKHHAIKQRRTYVKEVKNCRLAIRHFRHVKKRAKAKKALTRLRTIANKLIRELQRKLPTHLVFETYQKDFLFYQQVLAQKPKDKNKIYSLHEPNVYVLAKGKDHKQYEYGNKVSIVSTKDSNIIVGVVSHDKNIHDSKTLECAIAHGNSNRDRQKPIKQAVCDRGYVGAKEVLGAQIILPKKALKKDNRYQRDKKRKLCKRRAAIEPIIGHLKSDFRLSRNLLKGNIGDEINVLMAACPFINLRNF
ncbi:Mobile element protein [uncultured Candidatus Thioglobus sp.]|nr:Mobile element protein [uncultured Candidatus Thioglobus sp.]